jgi:hypothetical protein
MTERRRFKQTETLEYRLAREAPICGTKPRAFLQPFGAKSFYERRTKRRLLLR